MNEEDLLDIYDDIYVIGLLEQNSKVLKLLLEFISIIDVITDDAITDI